MEVSHQKSCANLALLNRRPCEAMEPSFLAPAPQVRPGPSQRLPLCSCARSPVLHLAGVDLPSPLSSGRHPGRRLSPLMDVVAQVLSLLPSTCLTASLYRTPLSNRATDSTRHRHSAEPLPLPHRHSARRWFLLRFPFPAWFLAIRATRPTCQNVLPPSVRCHDGHPRCDRLVTPALPSLLEILPLRSLLVAVPCCS